LTDSAQGIDVSQYQNQLTAADLAGLDFAFAKATDGAGETDPRFAANWPVIKAAGKIRGAYHELRADPVAGQVAHFLATVTAAGLEPGDMLAVSVSDYAGVTGADALGFLDAVKAATEGRNPVICYTDLSVAAALGSCTGYPLWIAWPSDAAPASVAPWTSWKLWQWNETGVDQDAYNGTAADMAAWIASYAKPAPLPPAPEYTEFDMAKLPVLKQGDSDEPGTFWSVRRLQSLVALTGRLNGLPVALIDDDGVFGSSTDAGVRAVQGHYQITVDGIAGAQTWGVLLTGSPA
jgi:lysozyme